MASATAYRVIIIYMFMILGSMIITSGPQLSQFAIKADASSIITAVIELGGTLGAATAISAFSGVFIGAFVVLGIFAVFQTIYSSANPIGSILFSAAATAPPGLAPMLIVLGWLITVGFDATFAWAVIAIFAG
mgnify:CR=1 FL=1